MTIFLIYTIHTWIRAHHSQTPDESFCFVSIHFLAHPYCNMNISGSLSLISSQLLYCNISSTMTNTYIGCSNVAKTLRIQHSCSRRWFLKRGNRARHKLRRFCITIDQDAEYLWRAFSIHPTINRATRTPIDSRIRSVFSSEEFELCDNLRHIITRRLQDQSKIQDGLITTAGDTEESRAPTIGDSSTIATFEKENVNDNMDSMRPPPPFPPPAKRRSPNTSLVNLINGLKIENECRKKPSELKDSGTLRHRTDCALAYLIRLCG